MIGIDYYVATWFAFFVICFIAFFVGLCWAGKE